MTARIESRQIAGTQVARTPAALAALVGSALLFGGVIGVVAKSEVDALTASGAGLAGSIATSPSALVREAQLGVDRGPLAREPGADGARIPVSTRAVDLIGLSERLFPVTTARHLEHGPTR